MFHKVGLQIRTAASLKYWCVTFEKQIPSCTILRFLGFDLAIFSSGSIRMHSMCCIAMFERLEVLDGFAKKYFKINSNPHSQRYFHKKCRQCSMVRHKLIHFVRQQKSKKVYTFFFNSWKGWTAHQKLSN